MAYRLQAFISWLTTAAISAIALGGLTLRADFEDRFGDSRVALALILILVILCGKTAEYAATLAVARYHWLRRLIQGKQHIEGIWLDRVSDGTSTESYGILRISYADGKFEISGESFDSAGKRIGAFRTHISDYSSWRLRYAYEGMHARHSSAELQGYGEYQFVPAIDGPPRAFSGYLHDTRHMKQMHVFGERLTVADCLKFLSTPEVRSRLFKLLEAGDLDDWQSGGGQLP